MNWPMRYTKRVLRDYWEGILRGCWLSWEDSLMPLLFLFLSFDCRQDDWNLGSHLASLSNLQDRSHGAGWWSRKREGVYFEWPQTLSLSSNFYYLREKVILLNCVPKIFAVWSHLIPANHTACLLYTQSDLNLAAENRDIYVGEMTWVRVWTWPQERAGHVCETVSKLSWLEGSFWVAKEWEVQPAKFLGHL